MNGYGTRTVWKRALLTVALAILTATVAVAQTKITGDGQCSKPDKQEAVEVGDRTDHFLVIMKYSCTWATPFEMEGLKSKEYTSANTSDVSGDKSQHRGYVVITMDNGDRAFVRFTGNGTHSKDGSGTAAGAWSFTGGTGKLKGLTGKGTYKSTATAGSGQDHVEGEYSLVKAPAPKTKK